MKSCRFCPDDEMSENIAEFKKRFRITITQILAAGYTVEWNGLFLKYHFQIVKK